MTCTTCPSCGFDLETLDRIVLGDLEILSGWEVRWKGKRVKMTASRTLIVCALARADGARVSNTALAEAIGYEGDDITGLLNVHFCRIRQAFREIDPSFDQIERGLGRYCGGGTRWRVP